MSQQYHHKTLSWQKEIQHGITDIQELISFLELDMTIAPEMLASMEQFPLQVPYRYAKKINKNDLHDPLLKQILPISKEMEQLAGYEKDPLKEQQVNPLPGLLHKYQGRVLITIIGKCSVNCRYCFRRHFAYQENTPGREGLTKIIDYIKSDNSIAEVILSGGDPLIAKPINKLLGNASG